MQLVSDYQLDDPLECCIARSVLVERTRLVPGNKVRFSELLCTVVL
jgi:hypothetical protein